jgi:hypothetical protein
VCPPETQKNQKAEFHNAENHFAQWRKTEFHFAETPKRRISKHGISFGRKIFFNKNFTKIRLIFNKYIKNFLNSYPKKEKFKV